MVARGRLSQRFLEHQSQIERATNALLQIYREANRKTRTTPAPPSFDRPYILERIPIEPTNRDPEERERLCRSIEDVQELLKTQAEAVHASFDAAVKTYREIDELFPESGNGKN